LAFFFFGAKDEHRTTYQPVNLKFLVRLGKKSNWSTEVASRSLWWWHNVKNSSFWVAQEVQRECDRKGAERSPSYC